MKAIKKARAHKSIEVTYFSGEYKPINEADYPHQVEHDEKLYERFYCRSRFVVYKVYMKYSGVAYGFYALPLKKMFNTFNEMEKWADANDNNKKLEIICTL